MSGSAAPILVTGATGRHGSAGGHVARRLREVGMPVRILARTISERTDALAAVGALIERTPMSLREFIRVNRETLGAAR